MAVLLVVESARSEAPGASGGGRRSFILSQGREAPAPEVRIAPDTVTVLRMEGAVDAARTKLPEAEQAHFASFTVAEQALVLIPRESILGRGPITLTMALKGGEPFSLRLVPVPPAEADVEVKLFPDPSTPGALQEALEQVRAENAGLRRKQWEAENDLAACRRDQESPEALLAALMLDERTAMEFPPHQEQRFVLEKLIVEVEHYKVAGRLILVFKVSNLNLSEAWTLGDVSFKRRSTGEGRNFSVRARPASIPPGAGGRFVIVSPSLPRKSRDPFILDITARENPQLGFGLLVLW